MINFGPVTVTHNGEDLGKTTSGGSITLQTCTRRTVSARYNKELVIIGAEGVLNMFELAGPIGPLSNSLMLRDFGVLVLQNNMLKITLYSCKVLLSPEFGEFGALTQKPIKLLLIARADDNGNIIKLED